jgi:hypothetical protein
MDGTAFTGFAAIVDHGADAAEDGTADEVIAHAQRAVANQHGGHGTAAAIEFGFEHGGHGGTRGIGFEIEDFGHQQNHFEQQIEILFGAAETGTMTTSPPQSSASSRDRRAAA